MKGFGKPVYSRQKSVQSYREVGLLYNTALAESVVRVEALCGKTWTLIGSVQVPTIATDRNCTHSGRDHQTVLVFSKKGLSQYKFCLT
jgi:hypothetical protein